MKKFLFILLVSLMVAGLNISHKETTTENEPTLKKAFTNYEKITQ